MKARRHTRTKAVEVAVGGMLLLTAVVFAQDPAPTPPIGNDAPVIITPDSTIPGDAPTTAGIGDGALNSALKIVAPSGESLTSTEDKELETTQAVAQPPSVVLTDKGLAATGPDAEAMAVESASDLLLKLGVVKRQKPKPIGTREIDEETTQAKLYNEEEFRKYLGTDPTVMYQVVYQGEALPDPMIVPWIRSVVVLQERFDEAIDLLANQQTQRGMEILLDIQTNYPDSEYGRQAAQMLLRLRDIQKPVAAPTPRAAATATRTPTVDDIRMDPKVKISSVITDPQDETQNRVMINGRMYAPGESIRGFENHKVVRVTDDAVTLAVDQNDQNREFVIPVRQFSGSR